MFLITAITGLIKRPQPMGKDEDDDEFAEEEEEESLLRRDPNTTGVDWESLGRTSTPTGVNSTAVPNYGSNDV